MNISAAGARTDPHIPHGGRSSSRLYDLTSPASSTRRGDEHHRRATRRLFDEILEPLSGWIYDPQVPELIAPVRFGLADLDGLIEALEQARHRDLELHIKHIPQAALDSLDTMAPELVQHLYTHS